MVRLCALRSIPLNNNTFLSSPFPLSLSLSSSSSSSKHQYLAISLKLSLAHNIWPTVAMSFCRCSFAFSLSFLWRRIDEEISDERSRLERLLNFGENSWMSLIPCDSYKVWKRQHLFLAVQTKATVERRAGLGSKMGAKWASSRGRDWPDLFSWDADYTMQIGHTEEPALTLVLTRTVYSGA